MLKKSQRGIKRKTVELTIRKGNTKGNRFFKMWILPKTGGTTQFGLVISKKISKQAIIRNKLRRRIYELIRLHYDTWEKPINVVISAKETCKEETFSELEKNLLHILKQIN